MGNATNSLDLSSNPSAAPQKTVYHKPTEYQTYELMLQKIGD